ncbi:UbiA prenyltransferase family protein [Candidatus Poribacteria bacterium]|nr:UbiA prenyltransferase family protein [Candidatus Poribacteria bacterium]
MAFLRCLRPRQWVKNLLLFAGIVFAQRWSHTAMLLNAVLGFLVFCALSGVVYVCNDIADAEQDRLHPKKCKRPVASGQISARAAGTGAFLLMVVALGVSFSFLPLRFAWLALTYLLLVSGYSFRFKHAVVLDILILAMGFVIRALAGIEAIQIDPAHPVAVTSYFLLTTLFLALFLAIAKRRNELVTLGRGAGTHRKVLDEYSTEFLDVALTVATAGTLFSYALWTTQGQFARPSAASAVAGDGNTYLLVLTMPFVLYGVFRYLWLVFKRDEGGAPELLLLEDWPLLATVALWMVTVVAVLSRLH